MNAVRLFTVALLAAATAAACMAGGWYARSQTGPAARIGDPSAAKTEAEGPLFSEAALGNMGVTFEEADHSDYTVVLEVPASIAAVRSSFRPVIASWGGRVTAVIPDPDGGSDPGGPEEYEGAVVSPGDVIVEMIRAPIPVMDRRLTGDVVQAISEPIHDAAADLRSAVRAQEIATMEWERVKALVAAGGEMPVVPRQTEINLRYEVLKAESEAERIRSRLFLHGLTPGQIEAAAKGAVVPSGPGLWRCALERNGLWPDSGDEIIGLLPEGLRANPWTFAALGELNALGRCDFALVESLRKNDGLGARFHEIASLMMQGHSLEDAVDIFMSGALDPVARIRAPEGAPDWDVKRVLVRPGEKIESGSVLAILSDQRRVLFVIEAAGADLAVVQEAAQTGAELEARPLVASGAPRISGLVISSFAESEGPEQVHKAFAVADNEPISVGAAERRLLRRAWKLRPGMRYMVRIPVKRLDDRLVLPRAAVVSEGAERVIFMRRGEEFLKKPVLVEYENSEVVVLSEETSIVQGDRIAVSGALALSLALKSKGSVKVDESGGHQHGPT